MVNFSNSDNLPEFFKIYMYALSSKMLRIPPDFMENFGRNIPKKCEIRRAWGGISSSYEVDIKKVNNHWFFQKGWPNFVEENSLKEGDFLTFCYIAKSVFNVTIFSLNGCIKGAAVETSKSEKCEINEGKERRTSKWGTYVAHKNGNPCFSMVIMKTHLKTGYLGVPLDFWRGHLEKRKGPNEDPTVTLWVGEDAWEVKMVICVDRVQFRRGFSKFVRDNSLKLETLCTFQLIHNSYKNVAFEVTFST